MNYSLLREHLKSYRKKLSEQSEESQREREERAARAAYYRSWDAKKILSMTEEEIYEYVSKLWAMRIWGNKRYVVDKLIAENGFDKLKKSLADLVWGDRRIDARWDSFREGIKGMGPAMMSEILCHAHSNECVLWNRRVHVGFGYLGVKDLPSYDYQIDGSRYTTLSEEASKIAAEMEKEKFEDTSLLAVDYFIWSELQVEDNLSQIRRKTADAPVESDVEVEPEVVFIHNDVRDKLAEIGEWLGFKSRTEIKVADGSRVDTIWEATIGNMGRVIYVFEVQTKGGIDSLILNLLKALNNPAVQGVVAVSDSSQIETIRKHAAAVTPLVDKLRFWDYVEVLDVHEKLYTVNDAINRLNLVPEGF